MKLGSKFMQLGDTSSAVPFNFLQSLTTTCRTRDVVRRERQSAAYSSIL